jgi:hypothetical protein
MKYLGSISKMSSYQDLQVKYQFVLGEVPFDLNPLIGTKLKIEHTGRIICEHCGKITKKSYSQGHCFPCSIKLASCDLCIMKPETCHFDKGTCREPEWAQSHCFRPHIVYLANSSGLKVGITRKTQIPTRWIDQGASQALPILEVQDRKTSGQIEVLFKEHISDKTDWRKMLKGPAAEIDLYLWRDKLLSLVGEELKKFDHKILDEKEIPFSYPVLNYPEKVSSFSLDKNKIIEAKLLGIKGQYLIFDTGVFNVRAHTGYEVNVEV